MLVSEPTNRRSPAALAVPAKPRPIVAALVLCLVPGAFCPAGLAESPPGTQEERLEDATIVELVVRKELVESRLSGEPNVCLDVDGKKLDGATARYLRSHHLSLDSCPRGWWAGKSIHVSLGARGDADTIEVKVRTGDQDNRDVGIILREGTYTLHRSSSGEWQIAGYTKICCDPHTGGRIGSGSDQGNAANARGEQ